MNTLRNHLFIVNQEFEFRSFFPNDRANFDWEQKDIVVHTFKRLILQNNVLKQQVQEAFALGKTGLLVGGVCDDFNLDLEITFFRGEVSKFFFQLSEHSDSEVDSAHGPGEKEIGQFFDELSHEIRNSLQIIVGSSELLRCDENKTESELLNNIHDSAHHLKALLNNYLQERKNGKQCPNIISEPFDLKSLLTSLKNQHDLSANHKGLGLKLDMDTSIPHQVVGQPIKLTQILNNLLGNAIYHTEKGKVEISAGLTQIEADKVRVRFAVQDTGKGISDENRDRLFDAFEQIEPLEGSKGEHFGLGLAITKGLIDSLNSQIEISSKVGLGTCFYFELEFGLQIVKPKDPFEKITDTFAGINRLFKAKVLTVDDCAVNLQIMRKQLDNMGIECDTAETGVDAYRKVYRNRYPIVLLDYNLPDISGLALGRILQREFPGTRTILVSGEDFVLSIDELKKLGISAMLPKPFSSDELYELMMTETI